MFNDIKRYGWAGALVAVGIVGAAVATTVVSAVYSKVRS